MSEVGGSGVQRAVLQVVTILKKKNPPPTKPELANLQPKNPEELDLTKWRRAFFWTALFKPFWTSLEPYRRAPLQIARIMSELDLTFKSKNLILAENLQQGGWAFLGRLSHL